MIISTGCVRKISMMHSRFLTGVVLVMEAAYGIVSEETVLTVELLS